MDVREKILYFSDLEKEENNIKDKIKFKYFQGGEEVKTFLIHHYKLLLKSIRKEKRRINKELFPNP